MSNNLPPQFNNHVGEKQEYPGFPGYETRTVSEQDAQKIDSLKAVESSNSFLSRRVGSGLLLAVLALFSPLLLLFADDVFLMLFPAPAEGDLEAAAAYLETVSAAMEWYIPVVGIYAVFCICFWAGAGVRSVWDMIKHYAALSGIGLFITFVTPFIWAVLAFAGLGAELVKGFSSLTS